LASRTERKSCWREHFADQSGLEVRRATRGGRELVELQLAIARGEKIPVSGRRQGRGGRGEAQFQRPNLDQRMAAIAWLADRGFGKSKEVIELTGEPSAAQRLELLRRLNDEQREQLRGLLAIALNGGTPVPASDATDGRGDENPASQEDDREITLPDNGTPVIVPPGSIESDRLLDETRDETHDAPSSPEQSE
jgi:hypothetical protein